MLGEEQHDASYMHHDANEMALDSSNVSKTSAISE